MSSHWCRAYLLALIALSVLGAGYPAAAAAQLPGTAPLEWDERELPDRLMDGAHRFVERKIAESIAAREKYWSLRTFLDGRENVT